VTGTHIVAQGLAYGSLMLLARWLTPTDFGTVSVGTAIVWFAALFVEQGVWGSVIVQRGLTRAELGRAFRRCLLTAALLAGAIAVAAGEIVDRFARGGDAAAVAALALCLPLHAVTVVPMALLQKSMAFRRLGGLTAVANIGSGLAALLTALGGLGVWALVARQLVLFGLLAVLSSVLCLPALRALEPSARAGRREERTRSGERWFFLFAVCRLLNDTLGYLVIGVTGNAGLVGLYSLASTIGLAPSTQFSEQVGKVFFAAAAKQPETCRERTEQSVQFMSVLMLPLLPVGILIAPTVLPGVFGTQWTPMVGAFQVLLVVGIGHAIVNCIGEPLSGTGYMAFRAKVLAARCVATLLALLVLVPIGGLGGQRWRSCSCSCPMRPCTSRPGRDARAPRRRRCGGGYGQ
jgi:O-antigen/teichoic acid export membrane protein